MLLDLLTEGMCLSILQWFPIYHNHMQQAYSIYSGRLELEAVLVNSSTGVS